MFRVARTALGRRPFALIKIHKRQFSSPAPSPPAPRVPPPKEPKEHTEKSYKDKKQEEEEEIKKPPKYFWSFFGLAAGANVMLAVMNLSGNYLNINKVVMDEAPTNLGNAGSISGACQFTMSIQRLHENGITKLLPELLKSEKPTVRAEGGLAVLRLLPYDVIIEESIEEGLIPALCFAWLSEAQANQGAVPMPDQEQVYSDIFKAIARSHAADILRDEKSFKAILELGSAEYGFLPSALAINSLLAAASSTPDYQQYVPKLQQLIATVKKHPKSTSFDVVKQDFIKFLQNIPPYSPPQKSVPPVDVDYQKYMLNASYAIGGAIATYIYCRYRWGLITSKKAILNTKPLIGIAGIGAQVLLGNYSESFESLSTKKRVSSNLRFIKDTKEKGSSDAKYYWDASPPCLLAAKLVIPAVGNGLFLLGWFHAKYILAPFAATALAMFVVEFYRALNGPAPQDKQKQENGI